MHEGQPVRFEIDGKTYEGIVAYVAQDLNAIPDRAEPEAHFGVHTPIAPAAIVRWGGQDRP
jgi:hypothetical protein